MGKLESTVRRLMAPVKAPFSCPKSFALEQRLGKRRTIDLDERPMAAPRTLVNGTGDQLFTGPAFTDDEHGRVGGRHLRRGLKHGLHDLRSADQIAIAIRRLVAVILDFPLRARAR